MPKLKFDTGVVPFELNDTVTVYLNPTDSFFMERLFKTFEELEEKQKSYKATVAEMTDNRAIFDFVRQRDQEMRQMVDDIFQEPVCDALFKGINVYSMAGGLPIWTNLLLTIMEEIDAAFTREKQLTNPRIKHYLEKYHRK